MKPAAVRRLVAAAVLAMLTLLGVVVYRAGLNELPPPPSSSTVLQQAIGIGTRGSHDAWRFRAKRIITAPDGVTTTLEDVESAALYKSGKPYLEMTADRVTINMSTRDITVSGHVILKSANAPVARSLRTDVITWNNALQLLSIPSATTITSAGDRIQVGSVQWNVVTGQITVRNVDGTAKM
ncbi:MAG TPA: LPS export ABC transporter periplasmic protein LptC [Candidatus Dormibacteraeota bacterium]|nr:LPS export ABC transporter periplasmic protein LptC [Candidatus Dormibacteraeota bacterium]